MQASLAGWPLATPVPWATHPPVKSGGKRRHPARWCCLPRTCLIGFPCPDRTGAIRLSTSPTALTVGFCRLRGPIFTTSWGYPAFLSRRWLIRPSSLDAGSPVHPCCHQPGGEIPRNRVVAPSPGPGPERDRHLTGGHAPLERTQAAVTKQDPKSSAGHRRPKMPFYCPPALGYLCEYLFLVHFGPTLPQCNWRNAGENPRQ
jgi:hypothetical protein